MAKLGSVREQLDTFEYKMEQENGFVTDACDAEFMEIKNTLSLLWIIQQCL